MTKPKDLTNIKRGLITFIKRVGTTDKGQAIWLTQCDCGTLRERVPSTIRNNSSCGCNRGVAKRKDYTGQKIGKLTFICDTKQSDAFNNALWNMLCDCGKVVKRSPTKLMSNNASAHCGCERIQIGQRFNQLVVIEWSPSSNGKQGWKCQCDCGNFTVVTSGNFRTTKSCGCWQKSKKELSAKDPAKKLRRKLSGQINRMLRTNGAHKARSFLKHVPYTMEELKEHLENLFEPWMDWNNHGSYYVRMWDDNDRATWKWQLDHIIPQSKLPYKSMDDANFHKCWALENLRPYSAKQNLLDSDR